MSSIDSTNYMQIYNPPYPKDLVTPKKGMILVDIKHAVDKSKTNETIGASEIK